MKTKLLLFATALLCLAACNKQEIIDGPNDQGKEGDYMIEIAELDQPTKSNPSTVELNLANLVSPSSKSITAQLKKRSGSSWVNVDSGVSYSWSATSEDNQKFSGSGTVNQSCNVTAKKAGSGNITVSAAIGGTTVATQPVPVNVSDDRALSWTNATTSLTAGEVKTAVLNSNFSGTVTVSSDNSSFLVGTSENSLNATTSVTFSSNKTQTIYYKYTGSSQTTVKIDAKNNVETSGISCSIDIEASVVELSYVILEGGLRGVSTYNLAGDDPTTEFLFYDDGEEMTYTFKRNYWSDDILEVGVYFDKLTVVTTDGASQVYTGSLVNGITITVAGNPVYNLASGTSFSVTEDDPMVVIMLDYHGTVKEFYLLFERIGSGEEEY